jgi:hypothetical protein
MWFLLMKYKQGQFMAIVVSVAGMVGPKKGVCVTYIFYVRSALSLQEYT